MTFGGGVNLVDGIAGSIDRGVKSESRQRAAHVIVDCFGNTYDWQSHPAQVPSDGETPVPTHHDEGVQPVPLERLDNFTRSIHLLPGSVRHLMRPPKRIAAVRRPEDCPASVGYAPNARSVQGDDAGFTQKAAEPLFHAHHFPAHVNAGQY